MDLKELGVKMELGVEIDWTVCTPQAIFCSSRKKVEGTTFQALTLEQPEVLENGWLH